MPAAVVDVVVDDGYGDGANDADADADDASACGASSVCWAHRPVSV